MCSHKILRTVGDRLFCKECGEELPLEFLTRNQKPAQEPAQEVQEPAQKPAEDQEQTNTAPKRKTAKNSKKRGNDE